MGATKASMVDQTKYLADTYPPGSRVKTKPDGLIGRVVGYRIGAAKSRPNDMAMIVDVPGDVWVLYPDEVLKLKEKEDGQP